MLPTDEYIIVNIFTKVNSKYVYYDKIVHKLRRAVRLVEYYMRMIRNLREDADLTQTQVAEILGTSQTMYARYERGASELPIRHLITLCRLYHVSSDYILGLHQR